MKAFRLLKRRCQAALLALSCMLFSILNAHADIVVGSWNIQRLGHGGQKSYPTLAAIASKIDLLAVQEVMTEEGIGKLKRQLEKNTGESWSYLVSHALGDSSYKEMYAFVWRDSAVEYSNGAVVYLDRGNRFAREPFSAKFRSKRSGAELALGTMHVVFGKRIADRTPEIKELASYWQWMQDVYPRTPIVLLGDFNLQPFNAAWEPVKQYAKPLLSEGASTLSAKGHYANLYDNIWVESNTALSISDAGIIDFPKIIGWNHKKSRKHVSDHAPVYMTLGNATLGNDSVTVVPSLAVNMINGLRSEEENEARQRVKGNRNSKIYHRPDCPSYSRVSVKNRTFFESAKSAESAGYRLAGNCS